MPENTPIVTTNEAESFFKGLSSTTSASSTLTGGVPTYGFDPINDKEPRVNNEVSQGTQADPEYKPYGWDELGKFTQDSFGISPFGMLYRQAKNGTGEVWQSYKPTISEWDEIYDQVGSDEDVLDVVLRGADNYDEVKNNIKLYKQNLEIEKRIANSPWYWQLYSGLVQALGNPVDIGVTALSFFIPPVGIIGGVAKASKVAQAGINVAGRIATNVASGVAANQFAGEINGLETHLWRDVAAITTLSGAMEVAGYASGKLRASKIKAVLAHDKYVTKGEKPKAIGDFAPEIGKITASKGFATKLNDAREQLTSGLPSVTVRSKLLDIRKEGSARMNNIIDGLTHFEEGVRSERTASDQSKIYLNRDREALPEGAIPESDKGRIGTTLLGSGKSTFHEEVRKLKTDADVYIRNIPNEYATLVKKYGEEDLKDYVFLKGEGYEIPLAYSHIDKDPYVRKLMNNYTSFYKHRGMQNIEAGVHSNIWGYKNYVPFRVAKKLWINFSKRMGGDEAALRKLRTNLYRGVVNSPEHYEWFKEIYQRKLQEKIEKARENAVAKGLDFEQPKKLTEEELAREVNKFIIDEADKAAIGYADQNVARKLASDNYSDFSTGFSFTKERMPWNTAFVDRDGFSLNSLRADPIDTMLRYSNRSGGLIASRRVFGKDYDEFVAELNEAANEIYVKHHRDPKVKQEVVENIMAMYRRGFGMSINDRQAYDISDAFTTLFKNGMFSTVGTFMGALNIGEIGNLVSAYGAGSLIRSIPGVHNMVSNLAKKGRLSDDDIVSIRKYLVGQEFNERLNFRAALRDAENRFEELNPYLAKAVGISRYLSEHSLADVIMRNTQDTINSVITNTTTSELITRALNPGTKGIKGMFKDPKVFERLNISNKDITYMNRVLKKIAIVNKDGSYSINNQRLIESAQDDKFRDIFERLHNYVFEESLQRRTPEDIFTWEVGQRHPIFDIAMQFKSFAIQSYNKRFVKLLNNIEDGNALAALNGALITTGLSGVVNILVSNVRSLGMEEEARNDYLDRTIGFHDFKDLDKPEVLAQSLFYNTVNRNPILAAFALGWNTAGIGTGGKTTASINDDFSSSSLVVNDRDPARIVADMIPSYRLGASAYSFGIGAYNAGMIALDEDKDTYENRSKTAKQLIKGLNLLPTVPYLSPVLRDHVKDSLEEYKYGY